MLEVERNLLQAERRDAHQAIEILGYVFLWVHQIGGLFTPGQISQSRVGKFDLLAVQYSRDVT